MGLSAHSWDAVRVPMLLMYGSRDFGPFGEEPVWRSEAFAKGPAGNKYEVELEGGTHMGFAGLFRDEDHRAEVFQCAQLETLAFWGCLFEARSEGQAIPGLAWFTKVLRKHCPVCEQVITGTRCNTE